MSEIITIGLDIAKNVFQVHGVDAAGSVVVRKQLRRGEMLKFFRGLAPCVVGLEACATSHYWAREIARLGHDVRLLPPSHVKPYVKRGKKNDAADAAAICEAVTRPQMQCVPIKTSDQQGVIVLHRTRDLLVRQRTMLINAMRGHLAEFGIAAAQGKGGFATLAKLLDPTAGDEAALPAAARVGLQLILAQITDLGGRIVALEKEIVARHRADETSRNLATIPGIGPLIASAITATAPNAEVFASGRKFAAWIGLVPGQNSTGGKQRLGGITKAGDQYLRRLLVIGATGLIRYKNKNVPGGKAWIDRLLEKKPARVVSVALANKMSRIAWAVMKRGEVYRSAAAAQTSSQGL